MKLFTPLAAVYRLCCPSEEYIVYIRLHKNGLSKFYCSIYPSTQLSLSSESYNTPRSYNMLLLLYFIRERS